MGRLLSIATVMLFLASTATAQLGTWPFKSGSGGGGDSSLRLPKSYAVYDNLIDQQFTVVNLPSVYELTNTGTWTLSAAGWTGGTSSGASRGILTRDAGVTTEPYMVIFSFCVEFEAVFNKELLGFISHNGTTQTSSEVGVSIHNNSKTDCGTGFWAGDIAAGDTLRLVFANGLPAFGASDDAWISRAHIAVFALHDTFDLPVATEASNKTLTASQMSGGVITNRTATGNIKYILPPAVAGMSVTIINEAAHTIEIEPDSTAPDDIANLTSNAGDSVTSDGATTSAITLISTAANTWWGIPVGSWPDTN